MPKKTVITPTEILEITDTAEIPIVSVEIPTDYEAMIPDPVPATAHVASATYQYNGHSWDKLPTAPRKYENLLPIVATALATFTLGALVLAIGVMIGAGI